MFVQVIFSELLNLFAIRLGMVMHHYEQIVFQKDWFAVFKIKVTVTDNVIKNNVTF